MKNYIIRAYKKYLDDTKHVTVDHTMTCALCGADMESIYDNVFQCTECGYHSLFLIEEEEEEKKEE